MPQISSLGAFSDPDARIQSGPSKSGAPNAAQKSSSPSTAATDETQASPLQAQLTRLSTVLNGLQQNAAINRAQYVQVLSKVKSGTYSVDPLDVSKSIVNDLLNNH